MHEYVSHHLGEAGDSFDNGTNLSYGQNRSQITGSDTSLPPTFKRYITQWTPESVGKTKTEH